MRRFLILLAAATAAFSLRASSRRPAEASPYARYGIQDDAWLVYGPGTVESGSTPSTGSASTSSASRSTGAGSSSGAGERDWGGADAVLEGLRARGIGAGRDALGNAALGKRRPLAELGADVRLELRRASPRQRRSATRG